MQDESDKLLNKELYEKAQNKMNKIEILLHKLEKQYRIHLQSPENPNAGENKDFNAVFFRTFQNMTYLLQITLLELSHSLESLGLYFFQSPLLTLFQFFKYSSIIFMKENLKFFHQWVALKKVETIAEERKASQRKNQLFSEVLSEFMDYIKEVKGLKKNQAKMVKGNNYEKMEKIHFLLEQEGYELEQLMIDTLHSRDEIDAFLQNKVNTKMIHASGAFKVLDSMAFVHEHDTVNYDSLMKLVDKRIENEMPRTTRKKDMIHEITRNIFSKLQIAQKKKNKENKMFTSDFYQKRPLKIDLEMITLEKEVQTEDEENMFRKKSMAVRKMLQNKEIDNYTKELETYNDEIVRKLHALDRLKNDLENERNELMMRNKQFELKLKIKKEKNQSLKELIRELREKLAEISERDANHLMLFKNKEKEYEKLVEKQAENRQFFDFQMKEMMNKQEFLEKRLKESHLLRINSKMEDKPSLSNSPTHYDSRGNSDIENQRSNQGINERKKKQSLKKKRASTLDVKILNTLAKKQTASNSVSPREDLPSKLTSLKSSRKSQKNDIQERTSIMTRSRSVFVPNNKSSLKGLSRPEIRGSLAQESLEKGKEKTVSQPIIVTVSKSYIDSNPSEHKLETLEENSKDSRIKSENEDPSPIMEASFEKESVNLEEKKKTIMFLNENESIELHKISEFSDKKDFVQMKKIVETKEMACDAKPELKEQESTAYFVDKVELYLKKLQKMVEQNNQNMRYILERIFLNRNHNTFIEELASYLRKWSYKKIDKFTQTEDLLISIKKITAKPIFEKKVMSQTTRNEGFSSKREDISEFYDVDQENPDIIEENRRTKISKSQSQHISASQIPKIAFQDKNANRKQENNNAPREQYFGMRSSQNERKQPISTSFLFNKAIQGDAFSALNRTSSQEGIRKGKNYINVEGFKRQPAMFEEFLMKIDLKKEDEENLERERLIKRLSDHIQEMKTKNVENFAKIKHFFKYPFKTVKEFVGNEPEVGIDDGRIEDLVAKFVNKHRFCGANCKHLKRFYQRIGFINIQMNKKEAVVHKQFINKLPNLEENA